MPTADPLRHQIELCRAPLHLPKQNAVLVGHITDEESEMSGMTAYYIHGQGSISIGKYNEEDEIFTPQYSTESEARLMSHQAKEFSEIDIERELSSVGKALLDAYDFAETGAMADKQAHVFSLQLLNGFTRSQTAEILNISVNTVDSHRISATEAARAAVAFVSLYDEKKTVDIL